MRIFGGDLLSESEPHGFGFDCNGGGEAYPLELTKQYYFLDNLRSG